MRKNCLLIYMLLSFMMAALPSYAQTGMSDADVYEFMMKEKKKGTSPQQIAVKLVQSGVKIEQIRRVRDKYQKEAGSELLDSKNITGQSRNRVNNGDKKQEKAQKLRKRKYEKSDFSEEEYSEYERRQLRDYTNSLDFMFPDSLMIYQDEDLERTEKKKIFGHDIFNNKKLTFESSMNIATPANYTLGPGDNVFIDIYGASQKSISTAVSPEGTIDIENFGPVTVSGLTVAQATARVRATLGQKFGGSKVRLTVGQTKTISVQVMGAVNVPGTYTLSAFSTVFHALYMAGGVTEEGTLRNIRVFRNNKLLSTVDIYDYILNGQLKGNIKLADNDVIIVGTYDCLVNITGKVKRPMYYEMKKTESVETLLNYAGGFSGDAYKKTVRLIRKNGESYSMFTIDEFERKNFKIFDGDSVSVDSTLKKFDNMVVVKGAIHRAGMYEIGKEIRTVRDLINKAGGLQPEAFAERVVLHRKKEDKSLTTISFNLKELLENKVADIPLRNEDVIYILSKADNVCLRRGGISRNL